MLKSMTGYGKGEATAPNGNFLVEIRAVNHRYGEISVRMPRSFYAFENDVKRLAASVLKRGKIDISVQWDETAAANSAPQLDVAVARGYYDAYTRLVKEFNVPQDAPISYIMSQKGVMKEVSAPVDETELQPQLLAAVKGAVVALDVMRTREGEALAKDLQARRRQIAEWSDQVGERTPQVVVEYRQKLKARLELLLEGADIDESRLAQEVALLADRSDITEELVRLASHFSQFDEALCNSEPVGRKLDFLMQEMNREVNTIGSKSNDAGITNLVIQIKAEMEKMREQVQNVE
ncbi:MAG: YicC family protein [Desulfuromonadaceae bacterium]|nr:YicC family protein [Desulfuromonadaceae bacterium]MDD2849373.1 YicC family protein [Desulfuromonadaceae bacterium]MDD4129432.1 YicC family protein [Desulfuromonadaceae bacterium]